MRSGKRNNVPSYDVVLVMSLKMLYGAARAGCLANNLRGSLAPCCGGETKARCGSEKAMYVPLRKEGKSVMWYTEFHPRPNLPKEKRNV